MILALMVVVSACEDPGIVGSDIVDEGASVRVDTLKIDDYNTESDVPVFTGNRPYISVGYYDDALFGEVTATAVIRPTISATVDTLHPDAEFMLELGISRPNVYGDTTSTTELEFREMGESWRGSAWKLHTPVNVNQTVVNTDPVQIEMKDSVVVPLKSSWYSKYREFYYDNSSTRDSLYRYDFRGFAMQHLQGNKILAVDASETSFLVKNPGDTVATEIPLEDWGYSLERNNVPALPDSVHRLYSTQEQLSSFDFVANAETLGSENVSRAEMTFYTARKRMQNSLPDDHVRPVADVLNLYLVIPGDLENSLISVNPSFSVQIDSVSYAYSADITGYINQQLFGDPLSGRRFYGNLRTNNGVIRSTLIYNQQTSNLFPKILITSVNPDLESN